METRAPLIDRLAQTSLFADLSRPELEAVAHELSGSSLYVILDGAAVVQRDGAEIARLGRGDFFGEISILTEGPPTSDIVAEGVLHCLVIPRPEVERFLLARPRVMLRMLRAEANRLRGMLEWQS